MCSFYKDLETDMILMYVEIIDHEMNCTSYIYFWLLALVCIDVTALVCLLLHYVDASYYSSFQCIINHQALPCLLNLLTNNYKKSIKKEACWTISNITAGNVDQIQVSKFSMTNL